MKATDPKDKDMNAQADIYNQLTGSLRLPRLRSLYREIQLVQDIRDTISSIKDITTDHRSVSRFKGQLKNAIGMDREMALLVLEELKDTVESRLKRYTG